MCDNLGDVGVRNTGSRYGRAILQIIIPYFRNVTHVYSVIGCVTAMKMRLRTLLHSRRSQADAVGSYAKSMKGVTCDTSAS
jgi:hypothetical protein